MTAENVAPAGVLHCAETLDQIIEHWDERLEVLTMKPDNASICSERTTLCSSALGSYQIKGALD